MNRDEQSYRRNFTEFSEEEEKRFAEMDEHLRILNEEWAAGKNPPLPKYNANKEEFLRFRKWQLDRMHREIERELEDEEKST